MNVFLTLSSIFILYMFYSPARLECLYIFYFSANASLTTLSNQMLQCASVSLLMKSPPIIQVHVNLARRQAMFNICCRKREQWFQIAPDSNSPLQTSLIVPNPWKTDVILVFLDLLHHFTFFLCWISLSVLEKNGHLFLYAISSWTLVNKLEDISYLFLYLYIFEQRLLIHKCQLKNKISTHTSFLCKWD